MPNAGLLDARLVGCAVAAWLMAAFAVAGWSGQPPRRVWLMSLCAGWLLLAVCAWGKRWWAGAMVFLVAAGLGVAAHLRVVAVSQSAAAEAARDRASVVVEGRLTTDVRFIAATGVRPPVAIVPVKVNSLTMRGRTWRGGGVVLVRASGEASSGWTSLPAGSTIRVKGVMAAPMTATAQAGSLTVRGSPEVVSGPPAGHRLVNRLRAGLAGSMVHSSPSQAGLVPSLVVGDTSRLPEPVVEQFKATGLTHLTAVSGSNLVLLLGFWSMVAGRIGLRGWWLRGSQAAAVLGFVVLCRAEPSVVRAAAMGLVALAALGRTADRQKGLRHLCVAVMVLMVIDPWLSRSWGFALSAAATAGLILFASRYQQAMTWAPPWLGEALAVPLAAQLATQPLVTALSGSVSISGLVANVLAGPFVGPATVLGMLAAVSSLAPGPVSGWIGWVGGWTVEPLLTIAHLGANLPGAGRPWPSSVMGLIVITGLSVAMLMTAGWVLARRWLVVALAATLALGLAWAPRVPGWPADWRVVFCSVGQGDAAVLRVSAGQAVLVDTGPDPRPVVLCLRQLQITAIAVVVITHYHSDHQTGLAQVLEHFRVGRIVVSRPAPELPAAREVVSLAASRGIPVVAAQPGERWSVGDVHWHTIRAGPLETATENDASVMGVAEVDGVRVLLAGDSEPDAQRAALRTGADMRADVIAMPHHGSSRQERRFWAATGARLAVASAGVDNDYGHPTRAAIDLAQSLGMRVARTDEQGSIAISRSARGLTVVRMQIR